jgi:F420-dependent oxidoreductase-like protein
MRLCLMIEGQFGVTWPQWQALARAAEDNGLEALFRSDHYESGDDRAEKGSLDAWATLAGLATITSRLRLGTLVSPATFRHPSVLARNAVTVDHLSGGRVELGIGTGWWELEHRRYGFRFPPIGERMDVLAEQLAVVAGHWADGPFSFDGEHYRIEDLDARPKPVQRPRPPLVMGGAARRRSAELAARYADEYNLVFATPEECREARPRLDEACRRVGRDPATLGYSLMTGTVIGRDSADLQWRVERLAAQAGISPTVEALREDMGEGSLVGTVGEVAARLEEYRAAGIGRVMFQHQITEDTDTVEIIGRDLAPRLR